MVQCTVMDRTGDVGKCREMIAMVFLAGRNNDRMQVRLMMSIWLL